MFPIVKKFFPADDTLTDYIQSVPVGAWKPNFCVYHNTSTPNLAERPYGFTAQHMENLAGYYSGMGWHAGPHFFVDQNGVWAFSPITAPGVHSPSWNSLSLGIEHLGDYDYDDPTTGDGAKVVRNGIVLLAALHRKYHMDSASLRMHYEDPKTTHKDCPGKHIVKSGIVARLHAEIQQPSC